MGMRMPASTRSCRDRWRSYSTTMPVFFSLATFTPPPPPPTEAPTAEEDAASTDEEGVPSVSASVGTMRPSCI